MRNAFARRLSLDRPRSQDDTRSNIAVVYSPLKPTCSGACVGYLFRTQALRVRKTGRVPAHPPAFVIREDDRIEPLRSAA